KALRPATRPLAIRFPADFIGKSPTGLVNKGIPQIPSFMEERLMASQRTVRKAANFHDRLSRLTHHPACQLLGETGAKPIQSGSRKFEIDPEEDVYLGGDVYRVRVVDESIPAGKAVVVVTLMSGRQQQLYLQCDQCSAPCEHVGAALGFLLEEKSLLGLAAP